MGCLKIIFFAGSIFLCGMADAQTMRFSDLFGQKRKARRYLVEQIAQIQIYIDLASKGYQAVQSGLTTIQKITHGEFTLHDLYYLSLKNVNPVILDNFQSKSTLINHHNSLNIISQLTATVNKSHDLKTNRKKFILNACEKMHADITADQKALEQFLTSNMLELKDNDRLDFIHSIYTRSSDQLQFIRQLATQVLAIIQVNHNEEAELNFLKELHQINP